MGDVSAAMRFVQQQFGLDRDAIEQRARAKLALFEQWHADAANGADAYTAPAAR
ncbi:MAG: hypothetical protein AB7O64_15880 [Methylibium sp.]